VGRRRGTQNGSEKVQRAEICIAENPLVPRLAKSKEAKTSGANLGEESLREWKRHHHKKKKYFDRLGARREDQGEGQRDQKRSTLRISRSSTKWTERTPWRGITGSASLGIGRLGKPGGENSITNCREKLGNAGKSWRKSWWEIRKGLASITLEINGRVVHLSGKGNSQEIQEFKKRKVEWIKLSGGITKIQAIVKGNGRAGKEGREGYPGTPKNNKTIGAQRPNPRVDLKPTSGSGIIRWNNELQGRGRIGAGERAAGFSSTKRKKRAGGVFFKNNMKSSSLVTRKG